MKSFIITLLASLCMLCNAATYDETKPQPGGLVASLNATSLNNLLQTAAPLVSYYALNNQTFKLDYTQKKTLYKFEVDTIHIVTVDGWSEKKFEYVNGTDKVHLRLGGINVDMDIKGKLEALYFIPLEATHVNITNLTIDVVLETTSDDQVHWALKEDSEISFDFVSIKMKNSFLDSLVRLSSKIINSLIKSQVAQVTKFVDASIQALNTKVQQEGAWTWEEMIRQNVDFNLTMTRAPEWKKGSDLLNFYVDGLFTVPESQKPKVKFSIDKNVDFPERFPNAHSEQFWIHQSAINSLLTTLYDNSYTINMGQDDRMKEIVFARLPELATLYGNDTSVGLSASIYPAAEDSQPVKFNTSAGVTLGDSNSAKCDLKLTFKNKTMDSEDFADFTMNLYLNGNITMAKVIVYPTVADVDISEANFVNSSMKMKPHMWERILDQIFDDLQSDFNTKYSKAGWSLGNLDPRMGMIGGILQNITLTPYYADGFMYGGFSMYADEHPTVATQPKQEIYEEPKSDDGRLVLDFVQE